jgi:hypothetical protein
MIVKEISGTDDEDRAYLVAFLVWLFPEPLLTGIQMDDLINRIRAGRLGLGSVRFPKPYQRSVRGKCLGCGGEIWIGPEINKVRQQRRSQGKDDAVYCLMCCVVVFGVDIVNLEVTPLTRKKESQ